MNNCLKDEKFQDEILNQRIEAQKKYKIEATPTILINEKITLDNERNPRRIIPSQYSFGVKSLKISGEKIIKI